MKYSFLKLAIACGFLSLVTACKSTQVITKHTHIQPHQATAQLPQRAPEQAATFDHHNHTLLHTKLEISFDWQQQCLQGLATLKLQPRVHPQDQLVLDAQNLVINTVARVEGGNKIPLEHVYNGKELVINLQKALPVAMVYWIEIAYSSQFAKANESPNSKSFTSKGLFFINPEKGNATRFQRVWMQGQAYANSCWLPTIATPDQWCTQEFYITVEGQLKTLSNGILGYSKLNEDHTRTDYWYMDLPQSPHLFMLAIGDFAVVQDEWNDLELSYYAEPAYEQHIPAIFGRIPGMVNFFSEKFSYPYPWPKYSQVVLQSHETNTSQGIPAAMIATTFQIEEHQPLDQGYDYAVAQELLYQWFGSLVTCEPWAYLSLDNALACLGAYTWCKHKYGAEVGDLNIWKMRQAYLQRTTQSPVGVVQTHQHSVKKLFNKHDPNKSILALYTLQQYIGEETFYSAISHYLKKHAFTTVEIHQLREAFEEVAGEDLKWFFDQWFLAVSCPILEVKDKYEGGVLTLRIWQKQGLQTAPYKLPLTICIWLGEEKQSYEVIVTQQYSEFSWKLSQRPKLVYLDQRKVPAVLVEHMKDTAAYQHLYYQEQNFFAKHEALTYCIQNVHLPECYQVLQRALQDGFWFFEKMAAQALKDHKEKLNTCRSYPSSN